MVQYLDSARRKPSASQASSGTPHAASAGSRIPPHNLDAERSLLGAMLLSRDAIAAAMETCSSEDFYKPAHAHIFDAIGALYSSGEPADPVTVADELARAGILDLSGGLTALLALQADTPATTNASRYARIVEEHALLRRLIAVAGEIAEMGYSLPDDVVAAMDRAESLVFDVAERRVTDSLRPLSELLAASMDRLEHLYDRGESITGVPTGFIDLDERLFGLQPNALIIVGARPAMGKCVSRDTRILDPTTGSLRSIEEICGRREAVPARAGADAIGGVDVPALAGDPLGDGCFVRSAADDCEPVVVVSLASNRTLGEARVEAFVNDGLKPVFKVRTRLGRRIRTTASHPFLTRAGWRPLADLAPGVEIAVPATLPTPECVCDPNGCTVSDPVEMATEVSTWARLEGRTSDLGLPESAFGLGAIQLRVFVSELADRVVGSAARKALSGGSYPSQGVVVFRSFSRRAACDVAHLLLRLSLLSRVTLRGSGEADRSEPRWEVELVGPSTLDGDVYWDEIVAIVADGSEQVYDLTVAGTHNFVADDMIVHNTSFALGIAAHAAVEARVPTLVFSLEMGRDEITNRLLVSESRVDANRMRNGKLNEPDWPKISAAVGRLGDAPLFIDDNPNTTVMEIRAKARRLKARQGGLGLIIVDYLQLMSGGSYENRQLEVSSISRGLKILARELEVPVVALSQLSRQLEARADKRPVLADLRESGSLEQDADVVMFLYRDEVYNPESQDKGTAEVIVAKHRNGPTGKIQLAFLDHFTRFVNMARV